MSKGRGQPRPFFHSSAQQEGLNLLALPGRLNGLGDFGEVRHQRGGLLRRIILPERHEVHVFLVQQGSDILGGAAESVVCGDGNDQRPAIAQMGLGRHSHRGIGDPGGQLCQGVARTGADDHNVQQLLGPDGLGGLDGVNGPLVADALHLLHKVVGRSEAGIRGRALLGDDGGHVAVAPLDLLQGRHGHVVCTEGTAKGKSYPQLFHAHTPNSLNIL